MYVWPDCRRRGSEEGSAGKRVQHRHGVYALHGGYVCPGLQTQSVRTSNEGCSAESKELLLWRPKDGGDIVRAEGVLPKMETASKARKAVGRPPPHPPRREPAKDKTH